MEFFEVFGYICEAIFWILECFSSSDRTDEWKPLKGKVQDVKDVPLWRQ